MEGGCYSLNMAERTGTVVSDCERYRSWQYAYLYILFVTPVSARLCCRLRFRDINYVSRRDSLASESHRPYYSIIQE